MKFRTVEDFLDWGERYMADGNRRYVSDALADGGDPDDIDDMLAMFADEQAAWRAKTRAQLEHFLADCSGVSSSANRPS